MSLGTGPSPISGNEAFPDDILSTATAIAERNARSMAIMGMISAEIQGIPYEEASDERQRAALIGRSAMMLVRIENPDRVIPLGEILDATMGSQGYAYQADQLSELTGLPVDALAMRDVQQTTIGIVQAHSGLTDEFLSMDFARHYRASQQVAEERNLDIATVYSDDELYYEVARRAATPAESLETGLKFIESATADMFSSITLQLVEKILPHELRELITPEEMIEMAIEMQLDPELNAAVEAEAARAQEAIRQTLLYDFIRTYGYDEVNKLTDEQKDILLPKMPLARMLAEVVRDSPDA